MFFFSLLLLSSRSCRRDPPASDKTHKHFAAFAFLIGFESTAQRHPGALAPLSSSAGGAGCGTQSLQKILLMYAELMTLNFFFLPPPFTVVFSLLRNSSGLYLGRKKKRSVRLAGCGAQPKAITLYAGAYSGEPLGATLTLPSGLRRQMRISLYLGNKPPNLQRKGGSEHMGE